MSGCIAVVSVLDTEKMSKSRKWKKQRKMYELNKFMFVWLIEQISTTNKHDIDKDGLEFWM